jgi:hypothetical protein
MKVDMGKFRRLLLLTPLIFGCTQTAPNPPAGEKISDIREQNAGYSLLYQLMKDESDVKDIFLFKEADDSVGNLIREISNHCSAAKSEMDQFQKTDARLDYDVPNLPQIEQESRALARSEDTHDLLGSSGKPFELHLIFTQAQAMGYARDLSQALANHENDPERKTFLTDLSKQCADYNERLMGLLAAKP